MLKMRLMIWVMLNCNMKYYILFLIGILSSCTPLSEQEKELKTRVESLKSELSSLYSDVLNQKQNLKHLSEEVSSYETKRDIHNMGKTPVYIVTLHFQEHKMEISWDRISFNFEIPVDEFFYNECRVGEQLGSGRRTMKLLHSGDITIQGKRIDYR